DPIADVSEDQAAHRPCDEADGERREGEQGAGGRFAAWEEQLRKHDSGRRAVQEEVVPLDGGPDQARQDDGPQLGLRDFLDLRAVAGHSDSLKMPDSASRVTGRGTTAS